MTDRRARLRAAAALLFLAGPAAAGAEDELDRLPRVPSDRIISHGYSDFTDPLGRFMDLLAAGAVAEARTIQPDACAVWLATRQTSALTGRFWAWNVEINLDTLCARRRRD